MKSKGLNKAVLIGGLAITFPLLLLFALSFGKNPYRIDSPLVGRAAPPFDLAPIGGGPAVSLASLKGKPAVINFWATWCEPCQREHRVLQDGARSLGSQVQFVGIVFDDEEARIRTFLDQFGSGYPALIDKGGKTSIAYGVYGVPETFFVDAQGKVLSKFEGPLDRQQLIERIARLLETT